MSYGIKGSFHVIATTSLHPLWGKLTFTPKEIRGSDTVPLPPSEIGTFSHTPYKYSNDQR